MDNAQKHIILFSGPITQASVANLISTFLIALKDFLVSSFEVHFSSEGGDLCAGFTAYNFIRSLPVEVCMHNIGTVESIAVLPFLAANVRSCVPSAKFLLHSFHWGFTDATRIDMQRMEEHSASLRFDTLRYADIFKERTNNAQLPIDVAKHLNGDAIILSASAAAEAGVTNTSAIERVIDMKAIRWWVAQS